MERDLNHLKRDVFLRPSVSSLAREGSVGTSNALPRQVMRIQSLIRELKPNMPSVQFSSVQSISRVRLFAMSWPKKTKSEAYCVTQKKGQNRDVVGRAPAWPEISSCGALADKLSLLEFRVPQTIVERRLPRNPVAFTALAPSEPAQGTQASAPRPSLRPEHPQQ